MKFVFLIPGIGPCVVWRRPPRGSHNGMKGTHMSFFRGPSGLLRFVIDVFRSTNHYSRLYWLRTAELDNWRIARSVPPPDRDHTPFDRSPPPLPDFRQDLKHRRPAVELLRSGISPASAPGRM